MASLYEPTAANMETIVDALRGLTLAFARQLPLEQRSDLSNDIQRLANDARQRNKPALEALLHELHAMANTASGSVMS
jgi:hypothetical protein